MRGHRKYPAREEMSRKLIRYAAALAKDIGATAMLVNPGTACADPEVQSILNGQAFQTILVVREEPSDIGCRHAYPRVTIPQVHMTPAGQVKAALLIGMARGVLHQGDRVVCLSGAYGEETVEALLVAELGSQPEFG